MFRKLTTLVSGVTLAEVALALTASAAGALVYRDFFATPGYLPAMGLAWLIGGVTAASGARRVWATLLPAIAGLTVVIVFGVFHGIGADVLDGVRGSWNRLLAVAVPADPWGELLVVPALAMWAVAFTSVLLVLRTRHVLAPVVPSLAGFVFAVFVVGNQAGGHAAATVMFLLTALVLIAVRAHHATGAGTVRVERRPARSLGTLGLVGVMIAASALFGVVGGPVASGERRFDVRDLLAPPITSIDTLTPLSRLKGQLGENPARELFRVSLDIESYTQVDRIRTAALDVFDGTTWTSEDSYRVAGSHLTADPALTRGKQVTAHVELKELPGPHLPVIGWPTRLDTTGSTRGRLGFDPSSGVVVSTAPKLQGLSYDVTGEISVRDDGLAQAATTAPGHSRSLPDGMPEPLRAVAAEFADRTGYDKLVALETRLRAVTMNPDRPPGHSYAAITRMFAPDENGSGYAEQHAAAFTVLARAMGFPARVAVGYRLRNYQGGVFRVTTSDAHAWSEVRFAGYGWVPFEPSSSDFGSTPTPPQEVPRVVPPQAAPTTTPTPPTVTQPVQSADGPGFGWNSVRDSTVLVVAASVLLLLVACGLVAIAKARRRRRRRRDPDHAVRVLGAWQEQIDRLTERGVTAPVSLTFHEVARHVRGDLGDAGELVEKSADLATTAVYAPEHIDESDSDQAWRLVADLRARLHPKRVSVARLRTVVDPRPLWTARSVSRQRRQARESLEMGRYR